MRTEHRSSEPSVGGSNPSERARPLDTQSAQVGPSYSVYRPFDSNRDSNLRARTHLDGQERPLRVSRQAGTRSGYCVFQHGVLEWRAWSLTL